MLTLRKYQRAAIDSIYDYFNSAGGNPLVVIPTGGGKSPTMAQFIYEAVTQFSDTRILNLTHVKELIAQNYAELMNLWPEAPAGIYSAGLKSRDLKSQIIFAGIQSIYKHAYALQRVDIVLIDEAQLLSRNNESMYGKLLSELLKLNPYLKIIGWTATPFRLDSGMLTEGDGAIFNDICYEAKITDLIKDGYLSNIISKSGARQIDTTGVHTRGGEFIAGELEAAALDDQVMDAIVDEIVAHGHNRNGWLVFGCGIKHCKELASRLNQHVPTATVFGETPSDERDAIIAAYKKQEIACLVSMGVLTTGFNARHVDLLAVVRPTKSCGLWIQMVGRGTRLWPGKDDCLVLDYGGNIQRHGPIDKPRIKQPGTGNGATPAKLCKECGASNPIAARECVECHAPFEWEGSKVNTNASTGAILSTQIKTKWHKVTQVTYRKHTKADKPPSMRVDYHMGLRVESEWICLEHEGYAKGKAANWWKARAPGMPVPATIDEALTMTAALMQPTMIALRPDGNYIRVVGVSFEKEQSCLI